MDNAFKHFSQQQKKNQEHGVCVSMQYSTQCLSEWLNRIKLQMAKYGKVDFVYMEGLWQNWHLYPAVVLVKKSQVFTTVSKSVVWWWGKKLIQNLYNVIIQKSKYHFQCFFHVTLTHFLAATSPVFFLQPSNFNKELQNNVFRRMLLRHFPVEFSINVLSGFHCIHEQTLHHKLHTHVMSANYKQTITENNHTIAGPLNLLLHHMGKIHPVPNTKFC